LLDAGLKNLAEKLSALKGEDYLSLKGGGAAGGLGLGAKAFLSAELKKGIEAVLDLANFDGLIEGASLVVTGEGKFDRQSLMGKVVDGIAARTKNAGVPLYVFCGHSDFPGDSYPEAGITKIIQTERGEYKDFEEIRRRARADLEAAAATTFDGLREKNIV